MSDADSYPKPTLSVDGREVIQSRVDIGPQAPYVVDQGKPPLTLTE